MSSNLADQTYSDTQERHKAAWMSFLDRRVPALAVTLSWNCRRDLNRCRADLKKLVAMAERRVLGSRFHRYPPEKRLDALFVFEGTASFNVHVHSLWWPPSGHWWPFLKLFPRKRSGLWDYVVPTGSYDVKLLNPIGNNEEFTGYILKQQGRCSDAATMVWAGEFHRLD